MGEAHACKHPAHRCVAGGEVRAADEGFDIELGELGYSEERNDVADYLAQHGWRSAKTHIHQLLADADLPPMPQVPGSTAIGNNYYCTSVKR